MGDWGEDIRPTLLVFSDDWGRHPSSCQHLVRHLLADYRVLWVNTIGTRTPRLDRATLARGWEKLVHWFHPAPRRGPLPENLRVLNPRMWPWLSRHHDRRLNRRLLVRQLAPAIRACGPPVVAVTTLPLAGELIGHLPVDRWVYYCVDDFSQWPGLDQRPIEKMEAELVRRADVRVAVSRTLQQRLARWDRTSHLLTHGVDLEHWAPRGEPAEPAALAGLERPLVLFWGLVDRRMDARFVLQLAKDLDCGTVVLLGPDSDPDPALAGHPRVARRPGVAYDELPAVERAAAVLVMPYTDSPVTRAIQPLKLKEYLATGKPVVVRDLPATRDWADALDLASTAEEFSALVRQRLADGLPPEQAAARGRLEQESWAAKAREFERLALLPQAEAPGDAR